MWIEPVRDWNIDNKSKFYLASSCELNLWGIETAPLGWGALNRLGCELNLWGIETIIKLSISWCWNSCELNLWGIETQTKNKTAYKFQKVWIEPVRDWNWKIKGCETTRLFRVNWTCEGLKLS